MIVDLNQSAVFQRWKTGRSKERAGEDAATDTGTFRQRKNPLDP